jgi:hypothetical protein
MGEKSKLSLLFQQGHLRELGSTINHVHPLKFLGTIFKDPYLKSCMMIVWNDSFKRNGFMEDLGPALDRESDKGKLAALIPDFATEVAIDAESIKPFFDSRDWNGFVQFLIYN